MKKGLRLMVARSKISGKNVTARAPTRIDLAGGTVDIWPLYLFHPGCVTVNAAVDLYAGVTVTSVNSKEIHLWDRNLDRRFSWNPLNTGVGRHPYPLFMHTLKYFALSQGVSLKFYADAPRGAGLAGSSALLVALCGALMKWDSRPVVRERFLRMVRDIETRIIKVPAGTQDYYPALWGGIQALWWQEGGASREPLAIRPEELEKRMILVYTGISRYSGTNNWEIFKQHLDGHRPVQHLLGKIAEAARSMVGALQQHDFGVVGKAMAEEYQARKKLFPGIATGQMIALEKDVKRHGAIAVKVCGAGGGGCMVVYADPEDRSRLEKRIQKKGYTLLPFRLCQKGLSFSYSIDR